MCVCHRPLSQQCFAQCLCFRQGQIAPGIHHGNSRDATGGFAEFLPAHWSQCIRVPDGLTDEAAVLADPFAVSLHAIVRNPPPEDGTVLVHGCGTLGLVAVAILRALFPGVRIFAVARFAHQAELARALGADAIFAHDPPEALIEAVGEALQVGLLRGDRGLPMLNGGVDCIYDTVTSPGTLETGVRTTRSRGRIVCLGVEPPQRFEWTPLYFKEIQVVGSNAFGVEEWRGRRQHAFEWYFEMLADGWSADIARTKVIFWEMFVDFEDYSGTKGSNFEPGYFWVTVDIVSLVRCMALIFLLA